MKKLLAEVVKSEKSKNFYIRVYKRSLIAKWEAKGSNSSQIEEILSNKEDLINDGNIIFDDTGSVFSLGADGAGGADANFRKVANWDGILNSPEGHFENYNDCAKKIKKKKSQFPSVYVHWRTKYNQYDGSQFSSISILKGMFTYKDFHQVSKK